jgi:hypothetical protein
MTSFANSQSRRPMSSEQHALDPGVLLRPGQRGWEEASRAWNLSVDQQPAAIGLPRSADDVVALMAFARERGLRVAPQATGHSAACLAPLEDSLLLRTSRMRAVAIDAQARRATVGAGAVWSDVTAPADSLGLAALAGSAPDVGVVGYTLGGGLSWLSRRYGLAANSLRRAEVVTADGRRLDVDEDHEAELFWALRGGGGSYAIVTELEFALHPVSEIYAGALFWPLERAAEVLTAWSTWVSQLPDELTSVARLLRIPPMPELPPTLGGRNFVAVEAAFIGSRRDGEHLMAPLRALRPELDTCAAVSPHALGHLHMDPPEPVPTSGDGIMLSTLTPAAIDNLLDVAGATVDSSLLCTDLHHLGGALARERTGRGAVSWLDAQFAVFAVGITPDQDTYQRVDDHVDAVQDALRRWEARRTYANFAERPRRGDHLFGESTHQRLRTIKGIYDPDDVIHANHPVRPARSSSAAISRGGSSATPAFQDSVHRLNQHR